MVQRITNRQQNLTFISQMNDNKNLLQQASDQVSTGIKVSDPSDDPARAATIAQFNRSIQRLEANQERISTARGFLETQESVVANAEELLLRASELASQAASGTLARDQRAIIAEEVFQLRDNLVNLANTRYRGVYIYSGAFDDTPPFSLIDGGYSTGAGSQAQRAVFNSAGNGGDSTSKTGIYQNKSVEINDAQSIRLTTAAADESRPDPAEAITTPPQAARATVTATVHPVFTDGIAALERLGRSLAGLTTEPPALLSGEHPDRPALPNGTGGTYDFAADPVVAYDRQSQDIREALRLLESSRNEDVLPERTSLGSRLNQLQKTSDIIDAVVFNTKEARSTIQDIDVFEAASTFQNVQQNLQALLTAGAQINNLSLLNFL